MPPGFSSAPTTRSVNGQPSWYRCVGCSPSTATKPGSINGSGKPPPMTEPCPAGKEMPTPARSTAPAISSAVGLEGSL
jgi:hypothetical protein